MRQFLIACLLTVLAGPVLSQGTDWREWRGGTQGQSSAQHLPTQLDPAGPQLAWRVPVRGRGISSPIVVGDRVFVTTAHRDGTWLDGCGATLLSALAALTLCVGGVLLCRRRRGSSWLVSLDGACTLLTTLGFLAVALMTAVSPHSLWALGRPGEAWLVTGAILLLGLAAAGTWAPCVGRLRPLLCVMLVVVAGLLYCGVPLDRYGIEHGVLPRLQMLLPGLLLAVVSLSIWLGARRRQEEPRGSWPRIIGGASLAFIALLLFWSVNAVDRRDHLARSLVCLDLESGQERWSRVLLVAAKEQKWPTNSYATPTPCSDGERVFVWFGAGWACVDLEGRVLWTGTDPEYVANSRYGAGASPILDGDQVLIWQENEMKNRRSFLLSLDIRSGALNWRVEPDDVHDSYATPILVPRPDGSRELVTMAYRKLVAHSTRDGARLWEMALPGRQVVPSLCYAGDDLLLVSGGTHLEFATSGIRLHGSGRATRPERIWQTRRNLSDICSPVLGAGLYFTIIDGRMRCLDPASGKVRWRERLGATDYWASLVAGDGKVYALSGDGELTVVAMDGEECRVLGEAQFGETCMATPALSDGRVLVRTEGFLYCFHSARPGARPR